MRLAIMLVLALAVSACGGKSVNMEREAARAEKKLNRQVAKAKPARASNWGYFSGAVETRWERDGRTMVLLNELRYTDPYGKVWVAPAGARVDGASIPKAFWSIMGGPFDGKYRKASVLHDVAYEEQTRSPQEVDLMFYNAMRASGVGTVKAKTMYYALVRHGRHWKHKQATPVRAGTTRPTAVEPGEVGEIERWIKTSDPDLSQVEARATGR
ncbi:hypothetical protein BH20VER1_BH20VER1_27460 [soil metagenome]